MTRPTSWMQFQDIHTSSARSEAWSELLGLRSNPRTTPRAVCTQESPLFPAQPSPHSSFGNGKSSPAADSLWCPLTPALSDSSRRRSLEVAVSAVPKSKSDRQAPLHMPASGLHTLDPFFSPVPSLSGGRHGEGLTPASSAQSLPRDMNMSLGTLSEVSSHPLLRTEGLDSRGRLSPVSSHDALAGEGYATRPLGVSMSPVASCEDVTQHEIYRRAALDFVLELAGPKAPLPAGKESTVAPDVIKADELPIPAFAIGRDANVSMWNKQMAEFSGWEEQDMLNGAQALSSIFQPDSAGPIRSRGCLELMRSVLFGLSVPPEARFFLKKKASVVLGRTENGGSLFEDCRTLEDSPGAKRIHPARNGEVSPQASSSSPACAPVELRFSRRTDSVGAVCGVLCVVAPVKKFAGELSRGGARAPLPMAKSASRERTMVLQEPILEDSQRSDSAAHQQPAKQLFDRHTVSNSSSGSGDGTSSSDLSFLQQGPAVSSQPGVPVLDRLAPFDSPASLAGVRDAGPMQVRAMVMESVDAVRLELKQNLARCGLDVTGCSSFVEVMWRFERSLADPADGPRFDVIFLELEPNADELFLAIRDLRRLEMETKIMGQVPALEAVHQASAARSSVLASPLEASLVEAADTASEAGGEVSAEDMGSLPEDIQCGCSLGTDSADGEEEGGACGELPSSSIHASKSLEDRTALDEDAADSLEVVQEEQPSARAEGAVGGPSPEPERRCLILAVVNLNRWDLAGLDAAMEQCVRVGGDAVIPRGMPLQQLKAALRKLGVRSKYLMFPSRLPRALCGSARIPHNVTR